MFNALMDWVMADVGRALWVLVVLMWAVVASAILVLALSWREKWAADDPETDLSDWPETKPMPLYGGQGPFTGQEPMPPAALTELANGSTPAPSSRQRPRWLG